jgi:hypothetical protein
LLLAMGLLLLPMVQMTSIVAKHPMTSTKMRVAVDMAQAAIDRFQQIPWESVRSSPPDGFDQERDGFVPAFSRLPAATGDSVAVQGTVYYRVWRVTQDQELPNLKTVTVWCCWREGEGVWRHAVLVTQLAAVGY